MFTLSVSHKDKPYKEITFSLGTVTLGRRVDNQVRLDDITVSGHHAKLVTLNGPTFIQDLGSTNGTYVNGQRIGKRALGDGDEITIGPYRLIYHISKQTEKSRDSETSATGPRADTPQTDADADAPDTAFQANSEYERREPFDIEQALRNSRSGKGDLSLIPEGIQWIAQDAYGIWWGYEQRPFPGKDGWNPLKLTSFIRIGEAEPNPEWEKTLREI